MFSGTEGLIRGTAAAEAEEGGGYGRSVCPETLGPHAGCNGKYNGYQFRKEVAIPQNLPQL